MVKAACADCTFFQNGASNSGEKFSDAGLCRFNPPRQETVHSHALWPVVAQRDWCGQFSAR